MNQERDPSLFWPKLTAIVLTLVFLSGISGIICLSAYAHQTKYSLFTGASKLFSNPVHDMNVSSGYTLSVFSQSSDSQENDDMFSAIGNDQADM